MSTQEFKTACGIKIPFGKYKGQAIDAIAASDEGLRYLDWCFGQSWLNDPLKTHLRHYLSDPIIKQELDAIT